MKTYIAYIRTTLRLTLRERIVIFFNYLFPLVFLIGFGELMGAARSPGAATQVFALVLTLNILGTGFFGAGMSAVMEREVGILRRFKVAPITPGPILVSSIVTGWLVFLPALAIFIGILHFRYAMPMPRSPISLLVFLSIGVVAFRAMGLIIASVVNSMQESQIIVQLLYLPMLMLSGATIPLTLMPDWLQVVAQYLPSTHLTLGMQGILLRGESITQNMTAVVALVATAAVSLFVCFKLFRWEKEDRLKPSAKLWVVAALAPFVITGIWQTHDRGNLKKVQILARQSRQSQSWLVRDARIFTGDKVIERGSLLLKRGKIAMIFEGDAPQAKELNASEIPAVGKTVLPGLIDAEVVLAMDAGLPPKSSGDAVTTAEHALQAYLYSGVAGVGSVALPPAAGKVIDARFATGEKLGAAVLRSVAQPEPGGCAMTHLSFFEAAADRETGNLDLLKGSLAEQVTPRELLNRIEEAYRKAQPRDAGLPTLEAGMQSLRAAQAKGTKIAAATLSGTPLLVHGPMLHHELQLMVKAGLTPLEALRAATSGAAGCLGASDKAGRISAGGDASLVLVEGNPLEDISDTERIVEIFFHGESVNRGDLVGKKQ
jgi:ABC-type multidrug transport system permease subunit